MDFNLSPEHLLIRKMMAEFTENEVKPIAAETDAKTSSVSPREHREAVRPGRDGHVHPQGVRRTGC